MADWEQIYEHRAEDYERLIAREDFEGRLLHAIEEIAPLSPTMVKNINYDILSYFNLRSFVSWSEIRSPLLISMATSLNFSSSLDVTVL